MHFFDNLQFGTVNFAMLPMTVLVLIGLALIFDFLNGFHDAANSVATVVSTRVLSPRNAVIWAAFFNFVAFLLFHLKVAGTIGTGIIDKHIVNNQVIAATLIAACIWDVLTWYWGLPTSSSHALIGGMVGAGLASAGWGCLVIEGIAKTALFIVLSPLIGMVVGLTIAVAVYWIFRKATPRGVDSTFRRGQLISAALYSLGHGGNDAQKTMGIIFVLLIATVDLKPAAFNDQSLKGTVHSIDASKREFVVTVDDTGKNKTIAFDKYLTFDGRKVDAIEQINVGDQAVISWKAPQDVPVEAVLGCHLAMGLGTLLGGCAHRQDDGPADQSLAARGRLLRQIRGCGHPGLYHFPGHSGKHDAHDHRFDCRRRLAQASLGRALGGRRASRLGVDPHDSGSRRHRRSEFVDFAILLLNRKEGRPNKNSVVPNSWTTELIYPEGVRFTSPGSR